MSVVLADYLAMVTIYLIYKVLVTRRILPLNRRGKKLFKALFLGGTSLVSFILVLSPIDLSFQGYVFEIPKTIFPLAGFAFFSKYPTE